MAYLVQTKFRNKFKDFHLNDCVYVQDYKTLQPDVEGAISITGLYQDDYILTDPKIIKELESVGLYVLETYRGDKILCMSQIKVYDLIEGEVPQNGTSYGWFNYQWLPSRQAKKEVETFLSTL